ncbi:hypothetical protein RRF57_000756 [Xylaria bambusicola]|uniref:Uncharacterized protein n=1 Tax=Xylaria bambusicola TaxID=326684 RepID=A0AAN7YUF4_9PEZI
MSSRLRLSTTESQRKIGNHLRGVAVSVSKTCKPVAKVAFTLFTEAIEGQDIWSCYYQADGTGREERPLRNEQ